MERRSKEEKCISTMKNRVRKRVSNIAVKNLQNLIKTTTIFFKKKEKEKITDIYIYLNTNYN
jgi:hypothetical protein